MVQNKLEQLSKKIGYHFTDQGLLKQALTHRSAAPQNNERLEFLGDSALSLVIAEALYERFSELSEGKMSRLRAVLVCGDMLADIARELDLGDYLILGPGELRSGGFRRSSILADALEAILAAVYLDGGFAAVKSVILALFKGRLEAKDLPHRLKDHKTQLQEILQAKKLPLPIYEVIETTGEEHAQTFTVACMLPSLDLKEVAKGSSRRKAEQAVASEMLQKHFPNSAKSQ